MMLGLGGGTGSGLGARLALDIKQEYSTVPNLEFLFLPSPKA